MGGVDGGVGVVGVNLVFIVCGVDGEKFRIYFYFFRRWRRI